MSALAPGLKKSVPQSRSDVDQGSNIKFHASRWRWISVLLVSLLALLLIYTSILYRRISAQSQLDETHPADAIVVFGAAEYVGKPSPVYRARLEHAAELFERGVAPILITSGGAGGDPRFTEGQVGRDYLIAHGIPESHIIAETQGYDTAESAARIATIMRANGMKSCDAVSDAPHIYRVKKMLQAKRIIAYGSPRPELRPLNQIHHSAAVLEEVLKYAFWKLGMDWF